MFNQKRLIVIVQTKYTILDQEAVNIILIAKGKKYIKRNDYILTQYYNGDMEINLLPLLIGRHETEHEVWRTTQFTANTHPTHRSPKSCRDRSGTR